MDHDDPLVWVAQIGEDCPEEGEQVTFIAYQEYVSFTVAFELTWRRVKNAQVSIQRVLTGDHPHDIHASLYRVRKSAAIAMAEVGE